MKDWPFFLAILALLILLLPMYENFLDKPADIPNGLYFIICGGKICSVEGTDGNQIIVCKKDIPEEKDLFLIEKVNQYWMPSGGYSIRPNPTFYPAILQCADEGARIVCNRGYVITWETFKITDIGPGIYTIQGGWNTSWNTRYCSNENGNFLCNSTTAGRMQQIQLISSERYNAIKKEREKEDERIFTENKKKQEYDDSVSKLGKLHDDLKGELIDLDGRIGGLKNRTSIADANYSPLDVQNEDMNTQITSMDDSYNENQKFASRIYSSILNGGPILDNGDKRNTDQSNRIKDVKMNTISDMNLNISNLKKKNEEVAKPL
jgi:hypothetical protein